MTWRWTRRFPRDSQLMFFASGEGRGSYIRSDAARRLGAVAPRWFAEGVESDCSMDGASQAEASAVGGRTQDACIFVTPTERPPKEGRAGPPRGGKAKCATASVSVLAGTLGGCGSLEVALGMRTRLDKLPVTGLSARLFPHPGLVPGKSAKLVITGYDFGRQAVDYRRSGPRHGALRQLLVRH